jgi:hypothetical protein
MSNKSKQRSSTNITYTGLGMAIGLLFGGFVGLMIGNLIIFAGGGMVLGLAIGTALDQRGMSNNP